MRNLIIITDLHNLKTTTMFEFNLFEFFGTIGVGLYVVISIIYFYFLFYRLYFINRHNRDTFIFWLRSILKKDYSNTGYALVTALLVYCAGLLTQDLTDHMTDSERNFNPVIALIKVSRILDSEGELRKRTLVVDNKKLTGLGHEVFEKARKILDTSLMKQDIAFFNNSEAPRVYWENNGETISLSPDSSKRFMNFVNSIYYTSKNWCYLQAPPIREELETIQQRIDFARSICIISFFNLAAIVLFYVVYTVRELCKRKEHRFKVVSSINNKRVVFRKIFYPIRAIIILFVIMEVSSICYTAAEKNFNERAMGYYVSNFRFPKVS